MTAININANETTLKIATVGAVPATESVVLTFESTGYVGDPNDPGAPSSVSLARKGRFFLNDTDGSLWRKVTASAGSWLEVESLTIDGGLDMLGHSITNVDLVDGVDVAALGASYAAHAAASSGVHGVTGAVVGTTDSQALSNKTLTTPTIASFVNATHSHQNAAGGGTLDAAAIAAGTVATARLGSGSASSSTALLGNQTWGTFVASFNSRTGAVVPATNDYTWAQIDKTTSSIADITTKTHALLGSLSADDHTQYLLLAGRSGGQVSRGGTGAGDNYDLYSTSNATKGKVRFGAAGTTYFNEVDNTFTIGSMTAASVPYVGAAGLLTQDNARLSYDSSNRWLNIGKGPTGSFLGLTDAAAISGGASYGDTSAGIRIRSKTGHDWFINADGTGAFNGVTDSVLQFGYNTGNPGGDFTNDVGWGWQLESRYQPGATFASTLCEGHINAINDAAHYEGTRRPYQVNFYWRDNPAGYNLEQNEFDNIFHGEFAVATSDSSTSVLRTYSYSMGTAQLAGDVEIFTRLIAANNLKLLKQKNAAGSAYVSLIYLDSGNVINIGNESTPPQTAIIGPLSIGGTTIVNSAKVYAVPTISVANSSGYAGVYFGPAVTITSGSGNVYGSEFFVSVTTASATTVPIVASLEVDGPTIVLGGGGATVTESAAIYAQATSGATTNWAFYGTGGVKLTTGNILFASASSLIYGAQGSISSPADGVLLLKDNAGSSAGGYAAGGWTTSFPYWRRSGGEWIAETAGGAHGKTNVNASTFYGYGDPAFIAFNSVGNASYAFINGGGSIVNSFRETATDGIVSLTTTSSTLFGGLRLATLYGKDASGSNNATAGANLVLQAGLGTGNGAPYQTVLKGGAATETTGSAAQAAIQREIVGAYKRNLTDNSSNNLLDITLVTLGMGAVTVDYLIEASDGTSICTAMGRLRVAVVNTAGTYVPSVVQDTEVTACTAGKTLTSTWDTSAGTNKTTLRVKPVIGGITPTTYRITYTVKNFGQQDVATL